MQYTLNLAFNEVKRNLQLPDAYKAQLIQIYKHYKSKYSQLTLKQSRLKPEVSFLLQMKSIVAQIEALIFSQVTHSLNKINIKIIFIKNAIPITIQQKSISLLLSRFLNKLNSKIQQGRFLINPETGYLCLTMQNVRTKKQYEQLLRNVDLMKKYLMQQINICYHHIQNHLLDILYRIGLIDEGIVRTKTLKLQSINQNDESINRKLQKFRLINKIQKQHESQSDEILKLIVKILSVNPFEYGFMYNHILKKSNFSNAECKQRLKKSQEDFNSVRKSINRQNINNQHPQRQVQYTQQWIEQFDRVFIRYLILPIAKVSNPLDNVNLFSTIYIFNASEFNKNQIIAQTGFSMLYSNRMSYTYINDSIIDVNNQRQQRRLENIQSNQRIVKLVVCKEQSQYIGTSRIDHQKSILRQLKDLSCVYVTKYYQTKQTKLKGTLIMDLYSHKSLDYYINRNTTCSLMTKIYIMCQLVQGLRFLRDNKITHLDIKPQNVLIGKGLLLRIADFGQSYHPNVHSKNTEFRPGYSLPYAAPEIFYTKQDYDEKADVYSLGILMHELFFNHSPINAHNMNNDKLINYYENTEIAEPKINNKIYINPENYKAYGPERFIETLVSLCLKCMSIDKNQRPYLDWILIQLRESINYMDKVY